MTSIFGLTRKLSFDAKECDGTSSILSFQWTRIHYGHGRCQTLQKTKKIRPYYLLQNCPICFNKRILTSTNTAQEGKSPDADSRGNPGKLHEL
jgi:hypothetical protein